jgi:hypothetical protein
MAVRVESAGAIVTITPTVVPCSVVVRVYPGKDPTQGVAGVQVETGVQLEPL